MNIVHFFKYKLLMPTSKGSLRNTVLYLITSVIIMLTIAANAQNTITLSQAINNGLANKKNIAASKLDETISKLQIQALYRKYWPQIFF